MPKKVTQHRHLTGLSVATTLLVGALVGGCSGGTTAVPPPVTVTVTNTPSTQSPAAPTSATPTATSSSTTSAPTEAAGSRVAGMDATQAAQRVRAGVATVTKVVTITEDNDPNNKLGRPGGYVSAAVLYDSGTSCTATSFGPDCGGTVEVWPTATDAKARMDYIQAVLKQASMLGTEYDYVQGPVLLRVTGKLKPSTASKYQAAFIG